jgi:hypothetical protein
MWRLLPILAGLGVLGLLVPWGHVAALVLSDASPMELRAHPTADPRRDGFVITRLIEPSDGTLSADGAPNADQPQTGQRNGLRSRNDGLSHVAEITFRSPGTGAKMTDAGHAPAALR